MIRELKNAVERAVIMANSQTITATDVTPRHLRPGSDGADAHGPLAAPHRRRASDRASENGSATVMGMTRDELFDAFSRFLNRRADAARTIAPSRGDLSDGASSHAHVDDEAEDEVIAERAQPTKANAKPKPKKKR